MMREILELLVSYRNEAWREWQETFDVLEPYKSDRATGMLEGYSRVFQAITSSPECNYEVKLHLPSGFVYVAAA